MEGVLTDVGVGRAAPSPLPHASWRGAWDEIRQKVAEEASTHRKLGEDFKGIHRKLGNFREDKVGSFALLPRAGSESEPSGKERR